MYPITVYKKLIHAFPRSYLMILLVTVCLFVLGCKEDVEDISGRYIGTQVLMGAVTEITIVIRQNGNQLTGTVTPWDSQNPSPFANGIYSDGRISFDRVDGPVTYRYLAAYQGGEPGSPSISGNIQQIGQGNPVASFSASFMGKN